MNNWIDAESGLRCNFFSGKDILILSVLCSIWFLVVGWLIR